MSKIFIALLALTFFFSAFDDARANISEQVPGVTFSPAVIDFGRIPASESPTQLLTVAFDRQRFAPGNLPSLRSQGPNGPTVTLFSQTIGQNTIKLVYRVCKA